jgi:hypothetical protein
MKLSLPLKNIETLLAYQQGIRGILRKVEIANCDDEMKENLKAVYELLYQLQLPENLHYDQHSSSDETEAL